MLNDSKDWLQQKEKRNLDIIAEEAAKLPTEEGFVCPQNYVDNDCKGCPYYVKGYCDAD